MSNKPATSKTSAESAAKMGTFAGVFSPSVLTILGIILFLRLGFVLGNVGLGQMLLVLLVSITLAILTSISLSAIATNLRVKGGGVYYLISRSLGGEFGGALGILLFTAQSLSIAFYCIGFGEAISASMGKTSMVLGLFGHSIVSLPKLLALGSALLLFGFAWLGTDWATRLQHLIMGVLALALCSFIWGSSSQWTLQTFAQNWAPASTNMGFWVAFALFFPAVTGFTQGANMSGDLKTPERSLPLGIFLAIGVSLVVYLVSACLLAGALPLDTLAKNYDSMRQVARFGSWVDAGIVAAALSSALASFMGAPRILQSLARDRIFPFLKCFSGSVDGTSNPRRGTLLSAVLALLAISMGNLNIIAPIVSMFFLISYGLLNYATYIEARGASPSFRPRFRLYHAHLSLLGAIGCLGAMLAIDALAGAVAMAILFAIQQYLRIKSGPARWADGRRSYYFQRVRQSLHAMNSAPEHARDWRPRMLTFSANRLRREILLRFGAWIEAEAGLNTAVRILEGDPEELVEERRRAEAELRADIEKFDSKAFALAVVSPDIRSGTHALLQAYGVGPIRANTALLNWMEHREDETQTNERDFGNHLRLAIRLGCNVVALHCRDEALWNLDFVPARERSIHVWWWDDPESRLMLLLAYLMTRDPEWQNASIHVFAPRSKKGTEKTLENLQQSLTDARIDAQPEVVVEPSGERIVELSGKASIVFLPLRMQGKQPTDPFGGRLSTLLSNLRLVALVRAAEDLSLDAEPEDGKEYKITASLDAVVDALEKAAHAQKSALKAEHAAELKRQTIHDAAPNTSENDLERLEQEVLEATRSADQLQKEAKKACTLAKSAAENAEELCEESPQALRTKAVELSLQAAEVEQVPE